ncbi:MAG: LAGLIDADG family homing endonuclease [Minisyncoccia bacterium]
MPIVETLDYPKKSHRKDVRLPAESVELAEFFGIMIGDGGINNPWQANITLNTDADASYIPFVRALIIDLFRVAPRVMRRKNQKATVLSLASTSVVDFLVEKGLVRGNKLVHGLLIPSWILAQNTYKMACVRGLMDTDGCLVLHKHKIRNRVYSNIYLSFSSRSHGLLEQVAEILLDSGLEPHIAGNGREVWLYSRKDVEKYLDKIGSSNERLLSIYRAWRGG